MGQVLKRLRRIIRDPRKYKFSANGHNNPLNKLKPPKISCFTFQGNNCYEDAEEEDQLSQHFFITGTINLDKKTPCDLESCPLRKKSKSGGTIPSGKNIIICRDCGLLLHQACAEKDNHQEPSLFKCVPELYKIPEIFGADLTTLVKAANNAVESGGSATDHDHPRKPTFVITKCVEEIERRSLDSEGIYRVSGSQEVIMKIQNVLEKDRENADLTQFQDLNSICGVLKLYLRLLPEPLITGEVFAKFLADFQNNVSLSCESAKKNLGQLPPAHKISLAFLLKHLWTVSQHKDRNKMSAYNLSSVLAPSIIVPEEMSLSTLKIGTDVVDLLIRNWTHYDFFGDKGEVPPSSTNL